MTERTKIAFILGWGRSGSTVLGNVLGELPGFFCVGEIHWLWQRALVQRCACGRLVPECPVWSRVLASVGYPDRIDPAEVWGWQREELRVFHALRLLRMGPRDVSERPALGNYARVLGDVYRAVAETTGERVIVDTSKLPSAAALLELMPDLDVYYVHLVRDPRAVAYSWQKKEKKRSVDWDEDALRYGAAASTSRWSSYNLLADWIHRKAPGRFVTLRYEDFVAHPRAAVGVICRLMDEPSEPGPFVDDRTFVLGENHAVVGNQSRFKHGEVRLSMDDAWVAGSRGGSVALSTALSLPLLHRYRYPVLPGRSRVMSGG